MVTLMPTDCAPDQDGTVKYAESETYLVRKMRVDDIDEVARLHARCFEGYFLTALGRKFLRRYYLEFCRHSSDYAIVASSKAGRDIVALVVGTADAEAHFRKFYRRNLPFIALLIFLRLFDSPLIRSDIWKRLNHMRAALRSVVPGLRRPASSSLSDNGPAEQCPVRLLGIAVAPEQRGSGLAALAMAGYEEVLRRARHKRVGLSVLLDNERAVAFYRKNGWSETFQSSAGIWFEKDL